MLPSVWLGFACSKRLHGVLDHGFTRAAVLSIAGGCAAAVVVKALWFS